MQMYLTLVKFYCDANEYRLIQGFRYKPGEEAMAKPGGPMPPTPLSIYGIHFISFIHPNRNEMDNHKWNICHTPSMRENTMLHLSHYLYVSGHIIQYLYSSTSTLNNIMVSKYAVKESADLENSYLGFDERRRSWKEKRDVKAKTPKARANVTGGGPRDSYCPLGLRNGMIYLIDPKLHNSIVYIFTIQ